MKHAPAQRIGASEYEIKICFPHFSTFVFSELLCVNTCEVSDIFPPCCCKIIVHAVVEWEEGGCSTDLCAHLVSGQYRLPKNIELVQITLQIVPILFIVSKEIGLEQGRLTQCS
jgi:hypothetical protein